MSQTIKKSLVLWSILQRPIWKSGQLINANDIYFLIGDIQCFSAEKYITKESTGGIVVETYSQENIPPLLQSFYRELHTVLSPLVGHGQVQERGRLLTGALTSHINSNLHNLLVLKIIYLDLSFNLGTRIFPDCSCKSEEYSCFEVTSNEN